MTETQIFTNIRKVISENDVVLFMKGYASAPQCGFSAQVAQILQHLGVQYQDVNILEDPEMRSAIKEYSNWPTVPQLYVKGELIGGCDIIREMYLSGELTDLLQEKSVAFTPIN